MKQDLVPAVVKVQAQTHRVDDGERGFGSIDETKPYYELKSLNKMEGLLFMEYYSDRAQAKAAGDATKAYECSLRICDMSIAEKRNEAKDICDLEFIDIFSVTNQIVMFTQTTSEQEKK
jgi:hypothetical protein